MLIYWFKCCCSFIYGISCKVKKCINQEGECKFFYKKGIQKSGTKTLGWNLRVGPWGGMLESDSHICFYNILNHIVFFIIHQKAFIWIIFSIFKENEVNTCFSYLKTLFPKHLFLKFLFEILMFFSQWKYNQTVARSCSVKRLFLKISQKSQERLCWSHFYLRDFDTGVLLWILQHF